MRFSAISVSNPNEWAAPPIGSALSASWISFRRESRSVGSFSGLLIKELKERDGFIAQKIARYGHLASAQLLQAGIGDLQFMEAAGVSVANACAVNDLRNPRPMAGRKTHGAGFTGGVNDALGKIDTAEFPASRADGVDFGVRRDVGSLPDHIVLATHHFSASGDASSERRLPARHPFPRLGNRQAHEIFIGQTTNVSRRWY